MDDSKTLTAVGVGVGAIVTLGVAAYFLSRQDEPAKLGAVIVPPEIRVVQLKARIKDLQEKLKTASPEEAVKIQRVLQNVEAVLAAESSKIEKKASDSQRQRDLQAAQEKERLLNRRKLKEASWARLGQPAQIGTAVRKLPWQMQEEMRALAEKNQAEAQYKKSRQRQKSAEEAERQRIRELAAQEIERLRPERLAVIQKQDEELAADKISRAALRERCKHVSLGALPRDILDFYRSQDHDDAICGATPFFTVDGRQAYLIRTLHGGKAQRLETDRWSKQDDNSWALDDSRHQEIEPPTPVVTKTPTVSPLLALLPTSASPAIMPVMPVMPAVPVMPATLSTWELKALKTIDDPDFTYSDADPDAKNWDAAFESLRVRGFMNIVQNPKNPNDSLFVMTQKGRDALAKLS